MTIALALVSSALFGAGVALQQRPAVAVPDRYAGRPGLLLRLVRQPLWVVGVVAELGGFALQVAALRRGSLVVVQPLITTSLLFTVALAGSWTHQVVTAREWAAVISVVLGLAAFLVIAAPSDRSSGQAGPRDWIASGLSMGVALVVLVWAGLRRRDRWVGAASLGLAAGLGDAFMAVLTKAFAHVTEHGVAGIVTSWVPYALCAAGLASMILTQTAYQTGRPKIALPLISVTEPLVSCGIGVGLFGEALHLDGARGPFVIGAVLVMAAGIVVLSRSSVAQTPDPVASR